MACPDKASTDEVIAALKNRANIYPYRDRISSMSHLEHARVHEVLSTWPPDDFREALVAITMVAARDSVALERSWVWVSVMQTLAKPAISEDSVDSDGEPWPYCGF